MSHVSVVAISEAFGAFWTRLEEDLGVTVDIVAPSAWVGATAGTAAVILSAGGAEREATEWLETHQASPGIPLLVVGTDPGRRTATRVVAHGASDYFALPADLEIFRNAVSAACAGNRARTAAAVQEPVDAFAAIVGESEPMQKVLERAARLLPHRNAGALILGETGTGKELLARAIHTGGSRRGAPFVALNCSAIQESLIESELFGHERGSFTDAYAAKPGLFEVADTGTLFLDEIGDLPMALQAKLLRVLEDKTIRRVGGTKERSVDVRILAATNDDLARRVREGTFRKDLFFRLSIVVLALPPLRQRGDDILLIADALLHRLAAEHGVPEPALSPELRRRLQEHTWPGNVRELKNALERALLLAAPGELNAEELLQSHGATQRPGGGPLPFPASLDDITSAAAHAMVELCGGNRNESARRLRISSRRLRRLLNGVGLGSDNEADDFPEPETLSL